MILLTAGGPLWQIGTPDGKPRELGLSPKGYAQYAEDPLFLAGSSNTGVWPYVLPGPDDAWAGSRSHRSDVGFGLAGVAKGASGRFTVDFADTHPSAPPLLELRVNGKRIATWQSPKGRSEDVILGNAATGKPSRWTVGIPGSALRNGNNTLSIVNARGSWAVYDALRLEGTGGLRSVPLRDEISLSVSPSRQAILRTPEGNRQPIRCEILNFGPAQKATLTSDGISQEVDLKPGRQTVELGIVPVAKTARVHVRATAGRLRAEAVGLIRHVRPWTIYLFPHSHVDIGYTDLQANVLKMHERNFEDAIAVAEENRGNPEDSKYRFNVESTWVLERYLATATPIQRERLLKALREKTVAVSGGYANLLTGVMHPEEMMQSFRYSRILGERLGLDFDTASQTDVPGVSWGDTVALHEAGIENLVLMPNNGDRVGGTLRAWQDKPFWWVGPSGRERILVWQIDSYSIGHGMGWTGDRSKPLRSSDPMARFIGGFIFPKLDRLAAEHYPYDIVGEPWSIQDNGPVDADVPVAAKMWNERYVYPRVVLSTLGDASRELTRRYGAKLPTVKGDYTPYWEDGVGSSAAETAINRATPDRLVQAETLFAMAAPDAYPKDEFLEAWRNAVLYSEHTWGAWNSIRDPDDPGVAAQWKVKRGFALTADAISRDLLAKALGKVPADGCEVRNTTSWPRTDLVRLTPEQSEAGDLVKDTAGHPMPSQRLKTGELAVLVPDVPPFAAKRLYVVPGPAFAEAKASIEGNALLSPDYRITLDPNTGAVASLKSLRLGKELAQKPLNAFLYLPGSDLKGLQPNGKPRFEVVEPGPLVATLRAVSDAPGTKGLAQDVTLVAGLDRIELSDALDKLPIRDKEGVHFAFPFAVPDGQVRIDLPWALIRPEKDQIAGANKNWLTTQGYADVSNQRFGVTWTSLDAPLMEVGEISANLLGSVYGPENWRQRIAPTQTLTSWALNNHWHTNYKADQEGSLTFRYVLQAHGPFAPEAAARLGTGTRQPLLVGPATSSTESLFTLDDPTVVATRVVPSDDGKAIIVRLYGATKTSRYVHIQWRKGLGPVSRTDLSQKPGPLLGNSIEVPGWGVVTLRVERAGL
ncbi:glycoside hydrolase family 38 C-terminal domain-containing protein [soil metagenome]